MTKTGFTKLSIYVVIVFISFIFVDFSFAKENENKIDLTKILSKKDIADPVYGNQTYGEPIINTFEVGAGILVAYQANYGTESDHSENVLKLFLVTDSRAKKLFDQHLNSVQFIIEKGRLNSIKGLYIETLCDVCDGWEVSEDDDVFKIPIAINMQGKENLKITIGLSKKEREELIERLDARINKNLLEKSSFVYGQKLHEDKKYAQYAEAVKRRIIKVLSNN